MLRSCTCESGSRLVGHPEEVTSWSWWPALCTSSRKRVGKAGTLLPPLNPKQRFLHPVDSPGSRRNCDHYFMGLLNPQRPLVDGLWNVLNLVSCVGFLLQCRLDRLLLSLPYLPLSLGFPLPHILTGLVPSHASCSQLVSQTP